MTRLLYRYAHALQLHRTAARSLPFPAQPPGIDVHLAAIDLHLPALLRLTSPDVRLTMPGSVPWSRNVAGRSVRPGRDTERRYHETSHERLIYTQTVRREKAADRVPQTVPAPVQFVVRQNSIAAMVERYSRALMMLPGPAAGRSAQSFATPFPGIDVAGATTLLRLRSFSTHTSSRAYERRQERRFERTHDRLAEILERRSRALHLLRHERSILPAFFSRASTEYIRLAVTTMHLHPRALVQLPSSRVTVITPQNVFSADMTYPAPPSPVLTKRAGAGRETVRAPRKPVHWRADRHALSHTERILSNLRMRVPGLLRQERYDRFDLRREVASAERGAERQGAGQTSRMDRLFRSAPILSPRIFTHRRSLFVSMPVYHALFGTAARETGTMLPYHTSHGDHGLAAVRSSFARTLVYDDARRAENGGVRADRRTGTALPGVKSSGTASHHQTTNHSNHRYAVRRSVFGASLVYVQDDAKQTGRDAASGRDTGGRGSRTAARTGAGSRQKAGAGEQGEHAPVNARTIAQIFRNMPYAEVKIVADRIYQHIERRVMLEQKRRGV